MKKNKLLIGIIIVLSIIILGVVGYIIFNVTYKNKINIDTNNNSNNINMTQIYTDLINDERNVITSNGEYSLEEYLSSHNDNNTENQYKYSFVDLDSDGILEIIFYYGYSTLVIHYEKGNVYGYDKINYMSNVKSDGTFEGRTDKGYSAIVSLSFDKTIYTKNILSFGYVGKYVIGDLEVTSDEYDDYINKQNQKDGIDYMYVCGDKEYNSVEFENIKDIEYDNKDIFEEKTYKLLELYNGPGYGDGTSFCGEINFSDYLLQGKNEYYYLSKTYKNKQELYEYWRLYLSNELIGSNDDYFIEQNGKLYCYSYGKDGSSVYNKEKSKFIIKENNGDEIVVIGRVWSNDAMGFTEFNEYDSYFDLIIIFVKNDNGDFVVNSYAKYI